MGRPKLYADNAEKMRVYRQRRDGKTVSVDRRSYEWLLSAVDGLRDAVRDAASAGDKFAATFDTRAAEDVLEALTAHFRACSVSPDVSSDPAIPKLSAGLSPEAVSNAVAGQEDTSPVSTAGIPKVRRPEKKQRRR